MANKYLEKIALRLNGSPRAYVNTFVTRASGIAERVDAAKKLSPTFKEMSEQHSDFGRIAGEAYQRLATLKNHKI